MSTSAPVVTASVAPAGGIGVLIDGTGGGAGWSVDYSITNNTFTGARGYALAASFVGAAGRIRGFIDSNTIGTNNGTLQTSGSTTGSSEAGGMFISIEKLLGSSGILEHYVTVTNNTIRDVAHVGIFVRSTNGGAVPANYAITEATIKNNTIDEMFSTIGAAIRGLAGGNDPDSGRLGLNIQNNVLNADTTADSYGAVFLDQIFGTTALYTLPGYAGDLAGESYGAGNASTDITGYLTSRGNTLTGSTTANFANPGANVYANDAKLSGSNLAQPAPTGAEVQLPSGALSAASAGTGGPSLQETLTPELLGHLLAVAILRWAEAGASQDQLGDMLAASILTGDLPNLEIAFTSGTLILLDMSAAGNGWFVDATPGDNNEFIDSASSLYARAGSEADGRIDLLSVLMHELGHVAGLEDQFGAQQSSNLMFAALGTGERRLPALYQGETLDVLPQTPEAPVALLGTPGYSKLYEGEGWN